MPIRRFQVSPKLDQTDPLGCRIHQILRDFGVESVKEVRSARLFLIEFPDSTDDGDSAALLQIVEKLLTDSVVETCAVRQAGDDLRDPDDMLPVEVFFRPGVMDNVGRSTKQALADMGVEAVSVRTGRRYELRPIPSDEDLRRIPRLLGNDCIEEVIVGTKPIEPPAKPPSYEFRLRHVPIRELDDRGLEKLSREGHLFLSRVEMKTIQEHFRGLRRDPTDLELETLAQTWSEHCVHKTLKARIKYTGAPFPNHAGAGASPTTRTYDNLLRDTIAKATDELSREGRGPRCLSVFHDNAGIIAFDNDYGIAFKVETHNHPSAIEPYGGAATGIGGVIRDILGCGLGAKPIANTDVFCVAPPEWPVDGVPKGIIHPKTVLKGVVAGVRDYGNRMGIPTVNGAVHFDPRYLGNPLVFCGCVGLIPRDRIEKEARPGDAVVLIGGRTGRDGIHGATFSSAELTDTHEDEFAHAVQIGNAIEEKKVADVILQARDYPDPDAEPKRPEADRASEPASGASSSRLPGPSERTESTRCLFSAVTDCGAGGLSSAVGEMGEKIGAEVDLERVPLKYSGIRYDEIWISEAQERMVVAVPPKDVDTLLHLAASEDVEATVIGRFTDSQRLVVRYEGTVVGDLDMAFLHDGLPKIQKTAEWQPPEPKGVSQERGVSVSSLSHHKPEAHATTETPIDHVAELKRRLGDPNTASKHWIIRQYDHEVQAGSVIKPLVGVCDGPADASVVRPRLDSNRGIAVGCGMTPLFGIDDPYWMAVAAIDEAVRNVVCVGGDPRRTAILDNFCWPNAEDPQSLGALVRMCQACYDAAKAYGLPFISGKDSLNNVFALSDGDADMLQDVVGRHFPESASAISDQQRHHPGKLSIPQTLLISALALVDDVNDCISSAPRDTGEPVRLFYVGVATTDWQTFDLKAAAEFHARISRLIRDRRILAAHDCSDGGVAVAVAEMAMSGPFGAVLRLPSTGILADPFVRPPCAYIVEAPDPASVSEVEQIPGIIAEEIALLRLEVKGSFTFEQMDSSGENGRQKAPMSELRKAWRKPLDW